MSQQQLTPEQRKAFDMVTRQALTFLLEDDHAKLIIAKAKAGDPKLAIVDAIQPVLQGIWTSAEQAGANLEMPIFLAAGIQVITILSEMLAVSGIIAEKDIPAFAKSVAEEAVQQHNAGLQGKPDAQQQGQMPPMKPQGLAGMAGGM